MFGQRGSAQIVAARDTGHILTRHSASKVGRRLRSHHCAGSMEPEVTSANRCLRVRLSSRR